MRLSRVLLAGVAVAGVAATTSAFTANNTFTVDNNVAGYGELTATGVGVTNIAYNPVTSDASRLQSVVFTVDQDTTSMSARMTLSASGTPVAGGSSTCVYALDGTAHKITCTLGTPVLITSFDRTALTVTSN